MRFLLDTHALVWWFLSPDRLSSRASTLLMDGARNEAVISAVVSWEMAIKVSLGKLDAWRLVAELPEILRQRGFAELPITIDQSVRVASLPLHHRDPFDRLLVAQAQDLNLPILSADKLLDLYDVKRLW